MKKISPASENLPVPHLPEDVELSAPAEESLRRVGPRTTPSPVNGWATVIQSPPLRGLDAHDGPLFLRVVAWGPNDEIPALVGAAAIAMAASRRSGNTDIDHGNLVFLWRLASRCLPTDNVAQSVEILSGFSWWCCPKSLDRVLLHGEIAEIVWSRFI